MVAFLDTEFLTSQIKGGPPAKLVSVGFVVCGKNFEEVTRFHSYIYAEDKLHDRFQEMTGIERKDLLSAPDYELVMEEVAEQLEAWEVSRIYVWGPDKYVIQRDLLEYRKDASKRTKKIVNRILRMIKDIEDIYSAKLDLQSAGIGSLKILCGLGTEVSHNALDDAVDLKNIIKHIDLEGCSEHMLRIMKKYTAEKEVYYRQRRFREKWEDVSEEIQEKTLGLLKELGKVDTVEARAPPSWNAPSSKLVRVRIDGLKNTSAIDLPFSASPSFSRLNAAASASRASRSGRDQSCVLRKCRIAVIGDLVEAMERRKDRKLR